MQVQTIEQDGPTFGEVLERFLVRCEERELQPSTMKNHRYIVRAFLAPAFGDRDVASLTPFDFDDLGEEMKWRGYKSSTIHKACTLAGGALRYAERHDWVQRNVARLAELPKSDPVERDVPQPAELAVFLEEAEWTDPLIHAWAWTLANTGMRPGECSAIMQSDLVGQTLTIERAVDVSHCTTRLKETKTGKTRRIALDDETIAVVRAGMSPFVFGADDAARSDLLCKRWKKIALVAGTTFTPRSMRHFHATTLILAGHTPKDVADRLGHANDTITQQIYIQVIAARDAALRGSVGDVLRSVKGEAA